MGPLCDHGCTVLYDKKSVHVMDKTSKVLLRGWFEPTGACLWRFSLRPGMHHHTHDGSPHAYPPPLPTLTAKNDYNMTSVKALVRFLHTAAGFPVKSTWLSTIRAGSYATWPGLTYKTDKTYHQTTGETLKGHMTQTRQGVCSTKQKATPSNPTRRVSPIYSDIPTTKSNELFVVVEPVSKLYTDDMGRFPLCSHSGHRYIILALHCSSNVILIEPFQFCHDRHCIEAYSHIMTRLRERGHMVDVTAAMCLV